MFRFRCAGTYSFGGRNEPIQQTKFCRNERPITTTTTRRPTTRRPTTKRTTTRRPTTRRPTTRVNTEDIKIKRIEVQVGANRTDGTDDDVAVKVCSEDGRVCCSTGKLDKRLKDDWSRNDNETWDGKALGECQTKKFTIRTSFTNLGNIGALKVTVNKNGTDNLIITRLNVQTENAGTGLLAQGKPKRR